MTTTEKITAEIKTISIEELENKLDSKSEIEFWNVLTNKYFNGEMIPSSRRVALDLVGRETRESNLPKNAEIIVYCAGPACPQSRLAAEKLAALGYENVCAFEGGLEEWKNANLKIENAAQSATA